MPLPNTDKNWVIRAESRTNGRWTKGGTIDKLTVNIHDLVRKVAALRLPRMVVEYHPTERPIKINPMGKNRIKIPFFSSPSDEPYWYLQFSIQSAALYST